RAFGRLPEGVPTKEQKAFLSQAVAGLARDGKVICVRLALFAEMMKGKPWTPASLKAVGGTEGVGLTFLEETFSADTAPPGQCYQLSHDYLVHSLRAWLTRKQKETRRGRAELLLADRASVWNARPENRQLPTFLQWTGIRLLTEKKKWTDAQRKMMRKADRYH